MALTDLMARKQLRKTRRGAWHAKRPSGTKLARKSAEHRIAVPHGLVSTMKAR